MVQPSYPHTLELKHSRPHSRQEFNPDGSPLLPGDPEISTLAPSDLAPIDSHANDDDSRQTEQPGTEPVNEDSIIRKEVKPGPGEPH
ncbi:MAG: hypothetical protein V4655_08495 [Bdellovibrionota bacterium]